MLERVKEDEGGIRLEDAPIIVSGGRGIGSAEGFNQLQELAVLLKGAVGAQRRACDNGWIAPDPAGQCGKPLPDLPAMATVHAAWSWLGQVQKC